jgi:hypothetical protein
LSDGFQFAFVSVYLSAAGPDVLLCLPAAWAVAFADGVQLCFLRLGQSVVCRVDAGFHGD